MEHGHDCIFSVTLAGFFVVFCIVPGRLRDKLVYNDERWTVEMTKPINTTPKPVSGIRPSMGIPFLRRAY